MSNATQSASGKKRKAVCVHLLYKEEYICYVDVKSKFQDVFNQVTTHLTLRETEYFGLAFKKDGEYQFVSNDDKITKHTDKTWKSGPGDGFDGHGKPILMLHFRVQFYVDQVVLLREKVTRHLYYLQLKDNVLKFKQGCPEDRCFQVAGYALQADFGNFAAASKMQEYFDPREYFPAWMVQAHGEDYIVNNTPVVHKDLHNVSKSEAEWRFIKETSQPPAAHNLHFYRLRKKKTDKTWNAWLGVCAKGIEIYEDMDDGFKNLISTFLWPDIGKLTFDKKKFEIRSVGMPAGRKFTYYTESDVKSKYLLTFSRNTHMFQMAIQPKLMEIRHLEEEDKRRYRESYVSSDPRDTVGTPGSYRMNKSPLAVKMGLGNRYSVVSDASSNTTSGIASDKMTVSFEENDDASKEIIIDGPPMLLNTPSQTRSSLVSTLPGYKPSPLSGSNRSPVLEHGSHSHYSTYTFPTSHTPHSRLTNQNNVSSGSVTSDRSGQSEGISLESSGSSGSYRKRFKSPQTTSSVYTTLFPLYSPMQSETGAREKLGRHSHSSRKDSFKDILSEIRAHQNPNSFQAMNQHPHYTDSPPLSNMASFHMEDLDSMMGRPLSLSGSSDQRGNKSYSSDMSHSSHHTSVSTVTSHDYENVIMLPHNSSKAFVLEDARLQEAEVSLVPMQFVDGKALQDIPAEHFHLHSQSETELAVAHLPEDDRVHEYVDLQVSDEGEEDSGGSLEKKLTHISVNNKKEVLHPEIEEIRGKSHAFSLPFISALIADKTLQSVHSRSGSIAGSYDMSSIRSTDSRISRISHDTDGRRLSISGYPTGLLQNGHSSFNSHRPFSWHSENFDLDAQLANLTGGSQPLSENHRSVPQSLYSSDTSWANTFAYAIPSSQERYSPELIASQLMIPPKLTSGGHNAQDANIRHKSLLKENVGIA
ncbi:protein expanded-like [Dreissena polymorpha]|uniref:FERM domain-containing protein n=1 Tax=Dreissena polymorpha TaxID=45954 RepID=A0A9D4QZL9_DREPO|nr:protein expanded-like [Dreissena polymorpha]XP_052273604.1 protein expanded-like [Dreissena polymorpha]XP_052273605.1 protein expanded-like [Dreissena polymorpha]KAH3847905.1 hypothetical protein DPMN_090240 [Dreissena polymorpha]